VIIMVRMVAISRRFLRRKDDIVGFEKEASGRRLFYRLYGVRVVVGSEFQVLHIIMLRP
jgi:hypothetical protein